MNDDSRNWPDDFAHENGNYQVLCVRCNNWFLGYKRRRVCRVCANIAPPKSAVDFTRAVTALATMLPEQVYTDFEKIAAEVAAENQKLKTENALLKRNVITVHVVPQPCLACKGTGQVFDAEDEEYMDCGTCHGTKTAPTPAPVILRDEVALFAVLMESRLRANDAEKGAQGWKNAPWRRLLSILRDQTTELAAHLLDDAAVASRAEGILREAADVANLAMMLADTQGDLFHNVGAV